MILEIGMESKFLTALQPFPLISNKKLTVDEKIAIQNRIDIRPWKKIY